MIRKRLEERRKEKELKNAMKKMNLDSDSEDKVTEDIDKVTEDSKVTPEGKLTEGMKRMNLDQAWFLNDYENTKALLGTQSSGKGRFAV